MQVFELIEKCACKLRNSIGMCAVAVILCRDTFCGDDGAFVCLRNVFFLRARHEHVACDGIANIDIRANDLLHAV